MYVHTHPFRLLLTYLCASGVCVLAGQIAGCHRGQHLTVPFLQMTYTAENPHADGSAVPGARPRFRPPRRRDPHATSPAPTTTGRRVNKCPVVSKRPLHSRAAAKMSPHISIGPEPVLTAHAPSPPAAGSHCPAKEDSAPHCGTEFSVVAEGWVDGWMGGRRERARGEYRFSSFMK
jgi:hypothetical protein